MVFDPYGRVVYEKAIVYCHTDQMAYEGGGRLSECLLHGGDPSYARCSVCPDNHGFTSATESKIPKDVVRLRLVR